MTGFTEIREALEEYGGLAAIEDYPALRERAHRALFVLDGLEAEALRKSPFVEREGEYELRCLSPQDVLMIGRSLESVYAREGSDGDLVWPDDTRPEEIWLVCAMVLGHEAGGHLRLPRSALALPAGSDET